MEELIRLENPELHHAIVNIIENVPDFYRLFEVRERWTNIDHNSVIWSNTYRELSNANGWSDVFTVMNSSSCSRPRECDYRRASDIPGTRLRKFIETFPTIVWLELMTVAKGKDGAFRMLVSSDRLDFLEYGMSLLRDEGGHRSSFERLMPQLVPYKLNKLIMSEILTDNVAATLANMYDEQMFSIKKIYTKRMLMTEIRQPTIRWGILRLVSYSILYLIDFTTNDWLNILNAREKTVRVPEDIIERIVNLTILERDDVPRELIDFLVRYSYPEQLAIVLVHYGIDDVSLDGLINGATTLSIVKTIIDRVGTQPIVMLRLIRENITTLDDDALDLLAESSNVDSILYEMRIIIRYSNRNNDVRKLLNIPKVRKAINEDLKESNYYSKIFEDFFLSGRWRVSNDLLATIRVLISPMTIVHDMTMIETLINTLHTIRDYTVTKLRDILAIPVRDTLENREIANRLFDDAIRRSDKQVPILLAKTYLVDAKKVAKLRERLNLNSQDYKELLKVSQRLSPEQ